MKIYVASSWKNLMQQGVVHTLRALGHDVYDFRHPADGDKGFSWAEIDPDGDSVDVKKRWNHAQYLEALNHPAARRGFKFDMDALTECDLCVLVLPCGKSSHLEMGYAVGAGKRTAILLEPDCENITGNPDYEGVTWMAMDPELMYKMVDYICLNLHDLLTAITMVEDDAAEPVV